MIGEPRGHHRQLTGAADALIQRKIAKPTVHRRAEDLGDQPIPRVANKAELKVGVELGRRQDAIVDQLLQREMVEWCITDTRPIPLIAQKLACLIAQCLFDACPRGLGNMDKNEFMLM